MEETKNGMETIELINQKIDGVKEVMVDNINNIMERGEKLEVLVDKTENLNSSAFNFKKSAIKLRRTMLCNKIKGYLLLVLCVAIICVVISMSICGLDYSGCKDS